MSDTTSGGILPSSAAKAQVVDGEAPVIGSIEQNGFSLQIEEDAFPGGTVVSVEPVSQDSISGFQNPEDYQLISAPVMIECESYQGEFFDSDVVLTVPIPDPRWPSFSMAAVRLLSGSMSGWNDNRGMTIVK